MTISGSGEIFLSEIIQKPGCNPRSEIKSYVKGLIAVNGDPFFDMSACIVYRKGQSCIIAWTTINIFSNMILMLPLLFFVIILINNPKIMESGLIQGHTEFFFS